MIRPALEAGRDVVCDRFTDSTVAYQGAARGLGVERAREVCRVATDGLEPDLTLLLRIDPERAAGRDGDSDGDRIEREGIELQRAVTRAYDEIARRRSRSGSSWSTPSATPMPVHAAIVAAVEERR